MYIIFSIFRQTACSGSCGSDIHCFIKHNYEKLLQYSKCLKDTVDCNCGEIDIHFIPQSWNCNLGLLKTSYNIFILKNDTFAYIIDYLSRSIFLKEEQSYHLHDIYPHRYATHSTINSIERKLYLKLLLSDPLMLVMLFRTYFQDYETFNLDLPCIRAVNCQKILRKCFWYPKFLTYFDNTEVYPYFPLGKSTEFHKITL